MVGRITPSEVAKRLAADPDALFLLDVREPDEREVAVIEPSLHIPMGEVMERLADIPREREIVVYCHMGARSEMIASFLEAEGYANVLNLTGGIDAWSAEVDPAVPRYS
ncbi:MAG: rhodanese-like domain-containing protein [Thermoplasmata archaeon]